MIPCSVSVREWVGHLCRGLQVAEWVKLNRMQRERERDGCGWLASALCWLQCWWWLPELYGILTIKRLFPISASRGLTPSFSSILCPHSFQTPSLYFYCHFVLHTTCLLLPWCFASYFFEGVQPFYIFFSLSRSVFSIIAYSLHHEIISGTKI